MRIRLSLFFAILLAAATIGVARAEERLRVVEIFASLACTECMPSERLLAEGRRPAVLVLSHHVDYWNYMGWRDPLGSSAATRRQQAYMAALRTPYLFTPQVIVDGRSAVQGTDGRALASALSRPRGRPAPIAVSVAFGTGLQLDVVLDGALETQPSDVWLVEYDSDRQITVDGGENAGRTLISHHVVRRLIRLRRYHGGRLRFEAALEGEAGAPRYGAAILVQEPPMGAIQGAGTATTSPDDEAEAVVNR